ncbi:hypothetical protein SLU01_04960 [Sporosarcina luteola]|uniref:Uncharacterized protein n=1 Tax=Sporosarcina luteola TaxID=582850 RepID=A0A511Z409_9BACL|nr:hypothetical protein SLU01_04960 [Sporosarcina luteola]
MRPLKKKDALISAKVAEIRQIEPFAVQLAQATPSGKRAPERKATVYTQHLGPFAEIYCILIYFIN